jgi:hypothetical protein
MKDPRGTGLLLKKDLFCKQKRKVDKYHLYEKMMKQEQDKKKVEQNEKV